MCGHCSDLNKCHNVNGSCLTGCEEGYIGELCNSGNLSKVIACEYDYVLY